METEAHTHEENRLLCRYSSFVYCHLFICMQDEWGGRHQRKWLQEIKWEMPDRWRDRDKGGGERGRSVVREEGRAHTQREREWKLLKRVCSLPLVSASHSFCRRLLQLRISTGTDDQI